METCWDRPRSFTRAASSGRSGPSPAISKRASGSRFVTRENARTRMSAPFWRVKRPAKTTSGVIGRGGRAGTTGTPFHTTWAWPKPSASIKRRPSLELATVARNAPAQRRQSCIWIISGAQSRAGRQPLRRQARPTGSRHGLPSGRTFVPSGQTGRYQVTWCTLATFRRSGRISGES
jgi:hypothetical protein